MFDIFSFLAKPLGWLLWFIYKFISNYFLAIFAFTLLTRLITFPFAIKSQKTQARRAKLHPKLSRLQKKYGSDPKKMQEMQAQLYEREGISQTEGCATSVVQFILLFGIIAVIYSPLSYISRIPTEVINASVTAIQVNDAQTEDVKAIKFTDKQLKSYKELQILKAVDNPQNVKDIEAEIAKLDSSVLKDKTPAEYVESIHKMRQDFTFFGKSLLEKPIGEKVFPPTVLWLIPLFSYLTSLLSSWISQKMMGNQGAEGQQGQGCMKFGMLGVMPLFSLVMTITVPSAVGAYWVSSNLVAVLQTVVVNKMYDLSKIREQAEIDFQEERRRHREDKKRLAELRKEEQRKQAMDQQKNPKGKKALKKANVDVDEDLAAEGDSLVDSDVNDDIIINEEDVVVLDETIITEDATEVSDDTDDKFEIDIK